MKNRITVRLTRAQALAIDTAIDYYQRESQDDIADGLFDAEDAARARRTIAVLTRAAKAFTKAGAYAL